MPVTESVETEYAGHRFRSRLEARWCVFFDTAGIAWEFEPHGLAITGPDGVTAYLPDFWLPESGLYAECKGFMHPDAFARTIRIARGLTASGLRFALLGHLPSVWASRWPCEFVRSDGKLWAVPWSVEPHPAHHRAIREEAITARLLLEGFPIVIPDWAEEPLERARWHRFPRTDGPHERSLGYGRSEPASGTLHTARRATQSPPRA